MARKQKVGLEGSATRGLLLDAAERIMIEQGYASVTSRRLGAVAEVKPQLVHYYFPTMDALFVALYRRRGEHAMAIARDALAGDRPLQAIWAMSRDRTHVTLSIEFMALANHRKLVRAEMSRYGDALRRLQADAVRRFLEERQSAGPNPDLLVVALAGIGLLLGLEADAGMSFGHATMVAEVERLLAVVEGDAAGGKGRCTGLA